MISLDHATAQGLGGQSIDGELQHLYTRHEETVRHAHSHYQKKLAQSQALKTQTEAMQDGLDESAANVSAVIGAAPAVYQQKTEELHQANKILEAFRCRHGLTRAPIEPAILKNLLLFAIMVFIEGMINASFFLTAHISATPISALLLSLLISLTNIAVSSCAGFVIGRRLDYGRNAADSEKFAFSRYIARLLFWGYVVVISWFHTTVGLVRYLETMDEIPHTLNHYWGMITTPESLFLILTGMVMSVIAYRKSLTAFDDSYPGYGERYRKVLDAQDAVYDFHEELQEEIESRFDEVEKAAEKTYQTKVKAVNQYNASVNETIQARHQLEQTLSQTQSQLRSQVTLIAEHHHAAFGQSMNINEMIKDYISGFQSFSAQGEIPPSMATPEFQSFKGKLNQAKTKALKELDQIFKPTQQA